MNGEEQNEAIRAAVGGDRAALAAVWREHRRWAAAVLLAHAPARADVEDLLQDVALKLCRSIGALEDPARFLPWLRAVALNTARSAGRRRSIVARLLRPLGEHDRELADRDGAARRDAREEGERVLIRLRDLEPELREPLLMKSVEGMSQRRIASILDLPETTVETRLARARRRLREALARDDEPAKTLEREVHR